jgi:predicted metalloprotease
MKWIGRQQSGNVEDRRGMGGKLAVGGGIGGIIIALLSFFFGGGDLSDYTSVQNQPTNTSQGADAEQDARAQFVGVVLQDTEDIWNKIFQEQLNRDYQEPKLVLFSGTDQSGCGTASAASGPFYCPLDEKVYIDLSFYDELQSKFQAPGDFAMAYVIAHEVGHHIQQQLGIAGKVRQMQQGASKSQANDLSVRLELQADFLAGVWAHHAQQSKQILESGDIEEALNAASAVGDDRIQQRSQGYVVPDGFTHGTSKQRMFWFKKGFQTGDIDQGDTFSESM